ncbi:MoaD/ThiS family protein [Leucobacter denitrificans]|uniref:MoaD/ThiS family protein n=1 Tax=Leucobacter denitrificans TaxID=683042 RepID=A0A7G9S430_9MICO|nr:MoaD/ThiS family protein [Leucobacter denitrificans]QNN62605.1 MoaD/ThiS family protein [Leucobacter denitrificans]
MATITVRYFAAAEDAAGTGQEEWAAPTGATLEWLRGALVEKHGDAMDRALRGGSFLIDGQVRRDPGPIGGLEVDVLPPFAGG